MPIIINNILLFTSETYPAFAGDGRNALLFAKTLRSMGQRSDLMCFNPNGLLKSEEIISGVNVFRVKYFYYSTFGRLISRVLIGIKILKIRKEYKYWLIYGGMPCHRFILVLGRVLKKKLIFRSTLWNFDDANALCYSKLFIVTRMRSRLYSMTSAYFALNINFKNVWIENLKYVNPVFLSTQGVDCDIYENSRCVGDVSRKLLGINDDDFVILIQGHLIKRKGFNEIFEWLSKTSFRVKVIHVGINCAPDWDTVSTKNKEMHEIKEYGISLLGNDLIFIGGTNDVPNYMKIADVFILNSESEGFSNSLSEAMISGLPPLVRRINGTEDFLVDGENALLFSSYADFINKLKYLISNPAERIRIGQNARSWMVNNNNIETVARNFINFVNANLS